MSRCGVRRGGQAADPRRGPPHGGSCCVSPTCPPSSSVSDASRHIGRSAVVAGARDNRDRVNCHRHLRASSEGKSEKGKSGEHENLLHGRIPLFGNLAWPELRWVGCDQNHENVRFRRGPVCHPEPPVRPRPPVEGPPCHGLLWLRKTVQPYLDGLLSAGDRLVRETLVYG